MNDARPVRRTRVGFITVLCIFGFFSGCMSPEEAKSEADQETYDIVKKARELEGLPPDASYTIEPDPERDRGKFILPKEDDSVVGPKERLVREGAEVKLNLAEVLAIAARNSRDYQDEKERLYIAALRLTTALNQFDSQYFGTIGAGAASNGDGESDSRLSLSENSSFGFTRMLESGGQYAVSIGQNLTRFLSNPAETAASSLINLTLSLPLLRGSGREIAYENVTQTERDVFYALRRFEHFKRQFSVDVVSAYLRLLQSINVVQNERANYESRKVTAEENRALGEAGRIARTDVERANQAELAAENRVISAEQSLANAKDQFLFQIGLPPDLRFEIETGDIDKLLADGVDQTRFDMQRLVEYGLAARLDLATARQQIADAKRKVLIAADALGMQLDFSFRAALMSSDYAKRSFKLDPIGDGTYSAGLDLDLPFERTIERNNYRISLINLEAALRTYEETEDLVKVQIRRNLRDLNLARESYRIQVEALKVSETNIDAARLLKDAGEGSTNDLLDAQNDFISSKNAVTAAVIDFTISRLELFRDLEVLVADAKGVDYDSTLKLLQEK